MLVSNKLKLVVNAITINTKIEFKCADKISFELMHSKMVSRITKCSEKMIFYYFDFNAYCSYATATQCMRTNHSECKHFKLKNIEMK